MQRCYQFGTSLGGEGGGVDLGEDPKHLPGRRRSQRLAGKCRPVVPRLESGGHLGTSPHRTNGHPVAEGLGHGDNVGPDPGVVVSEPLTGPSQAGLHLVDDEQQGTFIAQIPETLQKPRVGRVHAALPLQGFDENGADRGIHRGGKGIDVVPGSQPETFGQRLERFVLLGLPGGG